MPALENPKHERFAQELAKGKNASEAYVAAGYQESRSAASRLSTNVNVQARVAEIVDRGAVRAEVTVQSLIQEAEEARLLAMRIEQPSAAVSAIEKKAKLAGLWVDRSESENVSTTYVVSAEPIDDVEEWAAQHGPH